MSISPSQLAADWIRYHGLTREEKDRSPLRFSERAVCRLAHEDPTTCLDVMIEVLRRDREGPAVEALAAGPLEDLLLEHGAAGASLFEKKAQVESSLLFLLGGVWDDDFAPEVRSWLESKRRSLW